MRKVIFLLVVLCCYIYLKPLTTKANFCTPNLYPEIKGTHDINYEIGSEKPDWLLGVTAVDNCGNSVEVTLKDKEINLEKEGTYSLIYYANASVVTIKVNVYEDMTDPLITGAESLNIEVNTKESEIDYTRSVTVTDNKDKDIKLQYDASKIDLTKVGNYKLDYFAIDNKGNRTIVTVNVNVIDTIFPIIENAKNLELPVKQNMQNFNWWEGITISDNSTIFTKNVNLGSFDINKIGIYDVTYVVTDGVGNKTEKKIKVSVVDKIKPQIVLNKELKFLIGTKDIDWKSGLTITDNYDDNLLNRVICDTSKVDVDNPGTYKIVYFIADTSGNFDILVKDVIIYDDNKPEIINAKDLEIQVNSEGFNYKEFVTANDQEDGDLTDKIIVYDQNVDLKKVGKYKLIYFVSDRSGNTKTIVVNVTVSDGEKPVINGLKDHLIEVHTSNYNFLYGVSAIDNYDGDLTVEVDSSSVQFDKLGEYMVTYKAVDSHFNETTLSVKVTIVDTTKPEIKGYKDIRIKVGSEFTLLDGITAHDNYDGDLTNGLKTIGTYNINKVGEYQIKIEVEDQSGNYASAYFKVIVVEEQLIEGVDQKTMYYIAGSVGATILIFGFISFLTRKTIRRR